MANEERKVTLGMAALAIALAGTTTDALETPTVATRHAEIAAAMDRLDVSAGGMALGLAIKSQGNQALADIRIESARAFFGPSLPSIAHASSRTAAAASTDAPAE